jgi:regulator of protease activity HflC (stomatin/prohibitin superfamily)
MRTNGSFPTLIFIVIMAAGVLLAFGLHSGAQDYAALFVFGIALFLAAVTSSAIRVADQWSKAVVLRLGKFRALKGPGLFFIIPLLDRYPRAHQFLQSGEDPHERYSPC